MTLIEILSIIFIHWVADFILQDEEWATNKSKSNVALLKHVSTYSTFWVWASCPLFGYVRHGETTEWYLIHSFLFGIITFLAHFATDYVTSRIVRKKFAKGEYGSPIPNLGAFSMIGFDQVLHYVQLFLTYHFLTT